MNDTTMKSTVYAKKLRTRLALLKKQRVVELKKYDAEVMVWRRAMVAWLSANGAARVVGITKQELEDYCGRYRRPIPFDQEKFFKDAPLPPRFPSNGRIQDIMRVLRHLAITGQATVKVSPSDTQKLFGVEDED